MAAAGADPSEPGTVVRLEVTGGLGTLAAVADAARVRGLPILELSYIRGKASSEAGLSLRVGVRGETLERRLAHLRRLVGVVRVVVDDAGRPCSRPDERAGSRNLEMNVANPT